MNQIVSKEVFFPKLRVKDDKEITSGFEFGPDNGKDFFWISNGKATYQERLKITIYCSFEFENFPFDSHQCNLSIGVSNYSPNHVELLPLTILYEDHENKKNQQTTFGEESISISLTHSPEPFDITLRSLGQFELFENDGSFSFTG